MRLQNGLILYDPVDRVLLKVLMPHVEPVLAEVLLDAAGFPPLSREIRSYREPDREFWEPASDELWALWEATEMAAIQARTVTEDAT